MAVGLIRSLAVRRLATLASRTANSIDDRLVFVIRKTHLLLVWLPAFWLAGQSLDLQDRLDVLHKGTASPATGLQAGWGGGGAIDVWSAKSQERWVREKSRGGTGG